MPLQLPSLAHECISALLLHSNFVKAALQQVIPARLRAQITRRVILDGKVTAMRAALNTWPEEMLCVGDLCCREPMLLEHGHYADVEDVLPQVLQNSLGRVVPAPVFFNPHGVPLTVAFIAARFLELSLHKTKHRGELRYLDLTYYGALGLPELVPIVDALLEINRTDAAEGHTFLEPSTLSVTIGVSLLTDQVRATNDQLDAATEQLGRLLQKQAARTSFRCLLRITGLISGQVEMQRRARRLLRVLAQNNCPLEVLITNGPTHWNKGEQQALVSKFSNLRLLGAGSCEELSRSSQRPRPALAVPVAPVTSARTPRQYLVRSLVLSGCKRSVACQLKTACVPSGRLLSLSVSASLINLFALEAIRHLRRLSITIGHGPPDARPRRMCQLLRHLPHMKALQLLSIEDVLSDPQTRLLAAALPALSELRFCRLPTAIAQPVGLLTELARGARLAPRLTALHVRLEREPAVLGAWPLPIVASTVRGKLGQPQRENVCFYLTEMAWSGVGELDQMQAMPL